MTDKKNFRKIQIFNCEKCDYKCSTIYDFNRHLSTRKHQMVTDDLQKRVKMRSPVFACECGKSYKHRQSLHSHKKKCAFFQEESIKNTEEQDMNYKSLFVQAIKDMKEQRQEFISHINAQQQEIKNQQKLMDEMIDKVGNTTNNNLNINMFLNEQCKNAINFSDFVKNIEITYRDLENNAQLGFVNGMTKIFMDNLKQLTLHERPIHCTDVKKETLYIKDDDSWNQEKQEVKRALENGIQQVSRKSIKSLLKWKQNNPEYENIDSDFSNKCVFIQKESLPDGNNTNTMYTKIIHNLAKENAIDNV